MKPDIKRWIDMDSSEFNQIETPSLVKKIVLSGIEYGFITVDKNGYMFQGENIVHAELGTELVGLRYSAKAAN